MKTKLCHTEIKILKAVSLISLIILLAFGNVYADIPDPGKWQQIHTEKTILYFQSIDDLHQFNTRINYDLNCQKSERIIDQKVASNLADTIAKQIDALFGRTQEILEMQGFTNKIIIKIFKNKQQLNHAFFELYKKECNARAWYVHEKLTVYIQLDDLHEGMLAHEFAHAIIDHYMIIPPPGKAAEILARYVDTHLYINNTQSSSEAQLKGYSIK
ncbi:hypothetical protein [Desulfobacula sp.]|uniref:hypothetical protein n=1 Tax=Desulfobacula sp. TaxID=2593537 RepID=UPI00262193DF|nr:hypothetical protein [Desulfobacula sp.]